MRSVKRFLVEAFSLRLGSGEDQERGEDVVFLPKMD